MTYSKDWCKGFCRTCGTGCAEYCEQINTYMTENAHLLCLVTTMREALEEMAKPPYSDSDLGSYIEWVNCRARALLESNEGKGGG